MCLKRRLGIKLLLFSQGLFLIKVMVVLFYLLFCLFILNVKCSFHLECEVFFFSKFFLCKTSSMFLESLL